jgi:hypothetical protein
LGEFGDDRVGRGTVAPDYDDAGVAFEVSSEGFCDALPYSGGYSDEEGDWSVGWGKSGVGSGGRRERAFGWW